MSSITRQLAELQARVGAKESAASTGSLVPWAFGPRPLFLSRYLQNHFRAKEKLALLPSVKSALENEVERRPEFQNHTEVIDALSLPI